MGAQPWYRTTYRWCQTNLTEIDAEQCDVSWWRSYWKRNQIQGIIVNGGGIVSYYPSKNELAYRSKYLGDTDLLGAFVRAAREDGIRVVVRMDINGAGRELYERRPEWFSRDEDGNPYNPRGYYYSCINTGYYRDYVPDIFREIIDRYHPDGFSDNSWSGMSLRTVCYCDACRERFRRDCGLELPATVDWEDMAFRRWVVWSMGIRHENWDYYNKITTEYGGEDCLWMGMLNPDPAGHGTSYDIREVARRSKMMLVDHQRRDADGFEMNGIYGNMLHMLGGWDIVIAESMANYVSGGLWFRIGSNPPEETRAWMREGIAGGISPWTHFIGGTHEDPRQYGNPTPVLRWHRENEELLYGREPLANVGLVWSGRNTLFYGKDDVERRCAQPRRGFHRAMLRARIPFLPIHADDIGEQAAAMEALILPDLAVMSDGQLRAVESYVKRGGSLVVTGASGMLDDWGNPRNAFPLDELMGIERTERSPLAVKESPAIFSRDVSLHNYLRLPGERHEMLGGFEEADILPLGCQLYHIKPASDLQVLGTEVPPIPFYPPEMAYIDKGRENSGIPVIVYGETGCGGRIVYSAADLDRRYGQSLLGDHGDLLAAMIRWAAGGRIPLTVRSKGELDCRLYRKGDCLILHIVNLTGCHEYPAFVEEIYPVGPVEIELDSFALAVTGAELRCAGAEIPVSVGDGKVRLTIPSIDAQEMIVLR